MDTEVRTDVSPSIDPRALDSLAPAFIVGTNADGPVLDGAFSNALATMKTLHELSGSLAEAEVAVRASRDPQTEKRLRSAAENKLRAAAKAADSAYATIAARSQQVEAEVDNALGIPLVRTSVTDSLRASDVRHSLRRLSKSDRAAAVGAAIADGDVECCAAVFGASPLASGFTSEEVRLLRARAEIRFAGPLVKTRDALSKLRGILQRADELTRSRFGGIVGEGSSASARAEASLRRLEGSN